PTGRGQTAQPCRSPPRQACQYCESESERPADAAARGGIGPASFRGRKTGAASNQDPRNDQQDGREQEPDALGNPGQGSTGTGLLTDYQSTLAPSNRS